MVGWDIGLDIGGNKAFSGEWRGYVFVGGSLEFIGNLGGLRKFNKLDVRDRMCGLGEFNALDEGRLVLNDLMDVWVAAVVLKGGGTILLVAEGFAVAAVMCGLVIMVEFFRVLVMVKIVKLERKIFVLIN